MAHGAGAGMMPFLLEGISAGLAECGIATLRFQLCLWKRVRGGRIPLRWLTEPCGPLWRSGRLAPDLPLFAGGRSFGGRMTSQAQASSPLPSVRGLGCLMPRCGDRFDHHAARDALWARFFTEAPARRKRYHYESHDQLRTHLQLFLDAYHHARRLKTLRGLTPYEHVLQVWTKEPERFRLDPSHHIPGPYT